MLLNFKPQPKRLHFILVGSLKDMKQYFSIIVVLLCSQLLYSNIRVGLNNSYQFYGEHYIQGSISLAGKFDTGNLSYNTLLRYDSIDKNSYEMFEYHFLRIDYFVSKDFEITEIVKPYIGLGGSNNIYITNQKLDDSWVVGSIIIVGGVGFDFDTISLLLNYIYYPLSYYTADLELNSLKSSKIGISFLYHIKKEKK